MYLTRNCVIGLSVVMLCGLLSVHAIQVVPGYQVVPVKKGKSVNIQVTMTNTEDEEIKVTPGSKNWFVLPGNESFAADEWLVVQDEPFHLKPGEAKTVTYTIKAPKKAKGELVGMATFLTEDPTRTSVNVRMSVAVYAPIKGTEKYDGHVKAVFVDSSADSLVAGIEVENTGNVHMRFSGLIRVYDKNENPVANVKIKHGNPVYPGETKTYYGRVEGFKLKPGKYFVSASLKDVDWDVTVESKKKKFKLKKKGKAVVK